MKKKIPKIQERARRNQELSQYGKLLSLRPGQIHKSLKKYTRKNKTWRKEIENG